MKCTTFIASLLSSMLLGGCAGLGRDAGSTAAGTLAGSLDRSTEQLRRGLDSVGTGLTAIKDIDPLALKDLLARNQDLDKRLRELQTQFTSFGPRAGLVNVTPTNRVYFEITGFQGALRLDAWVDTEQNWFIRNSVVQGNPPTLNVSYNASTTAVEGAAQTTWRSVTGQPMDGHLWSCENADTQGVGAVRQKAAACRFAAQLESTRRDIDTEYKKRVEKAMTEFLASPYALPSGALRARQAIDQRLTATSGEHVIYLRVTPIQADPGSKWALEYRTFLTSNNGAELLIATGRIDSDTSTWTLGRPVASTEAARFFVEVAR